MLDALKVLHLKYFALKFHQRVLDCINIIVCLFKHLFSTLFLLILELFEKPLEVLILL